MEGWRERMRDGVREGGREERRLGIEEWRERGEDEGWRDGGERMRERRDGGSEEDVKGNGEGGRLAARLRSLLFEIKGKERGSRGERGRQRQGCEGLCVCVLERERENDRVKVRERSSFPQDVCNYPNHTVILVTRMTLV